MVWYYVIAAIVGASTVFQSGINRQLAKDTGLGQAVMINNVVVVLLSAVLLFAIKKYSGAFPEIFTGKSGAEGPHWAWWILPGICGFLIVTGLPLAIYKLGALNALICLMVAQIVVSLIWDVLIEGIPLSLTRVAGALLTIVGAGLASLKTGGS